MPNGLLVWQGAYLTRSAETMLPWRAVANALNDLIEQHELIAAIAASLGCFGLGNRAGLLYVSAAGTVTQRLAAAVKLARLCEIYFCAGCYRYGSYPC